MQTADFAYELPPELIAQHPPAERDQSRLLILRRRSGQIEHRQFPELLTCLRAGDVLVLNDSKVIPARLRGRNPQGHGEFEVFLLEENARNDWWAMLRPGKRAPLGTPIQLLDREGQATSLRATVLEINAEGHRRLCFDNPGDLGEDLDRLGDIPLPPYIKRPGGRSNAEDARRYQTVYARSGGSVAAPTAGLHFTPALLQQAHALGVETAFVTLHVGFGTFAPVQAADLAEHRMHEERFSISEETAALVNRARQQGRRVLATGTTTLRALESAADDNRRLHPTSGGRTQLFIRPPHRFHLVDALLTNFHLPCSTLLMLVSAFAAPGSLHGRDWVLAAYAEAIRERYRFFSYGDAMFIA